MSKTLSLDTILSRVEYLPATGQFMYKETGNLAIDNRCAGTICNSRDSDGYIRVSINGNTYLAHRLVYFIETGEWPELIDHENNCTWDNRFSNLRKADRFQNGQNAVKAKNNTSGVKGVTFSKAKNAWLARCSINGKRKHIGYFKSLEEAAKALDDFRLIHHREFANNGKPKD